MSQLKATPRMTQYAYHVVTYAGATGYQPVKLHTVHARDLAHAREKLAVLFRPLVAGELVLSHEEFTNDARVNREMLSNR